MDIEFNHSKVDKKLFNMFNGFGANINYMYKSIDGLYEYRFIFNSKYTVSSTGKINNTFISWYDILIIDWEFGQPNSKHMLLSEDEIKEKFNIELGH